MSAQVERVTRHFRNMDLSHQGISRSGSDSSRKTFSLTPNVIHPHAHTGFGGMTSSLMARDQRETTPVQLRSSSITTGISPPSACRVHSYSVSPPPNQRRGSTGSMKKGHSPSPPSLIGTASSISNVGSAPDRRGSLSDIIHFPKRDLRKFSQDSIEFGDPVTKHWEAKEDVIIEEALITVLKMGGYIEYHGHFWIHL